MAPNSTSYQDFADLLSAAQDHGVEFLVVGAIAMAHHGFPRFTGDLDLFIRRDEENAERLIRALKSAAFPTPFTREDLLDPDTICYIGNSPLRIEFLTSISGMEYEEAWESRVRVKIGGVEVPIIGLDALVRNKKAAARPKDLVDVEMIRRYRDQTHPGD